MRFSGSIARWALAMLALPVCAIAQLNQNCTVCVLNRCVRANADGSWVLPNIPAGFGQVKARATCVQGGTTTSGESAFFTLGPNTAVNLPEIVIGSASQIPVSLAITPATPNLTSAGQVVQLTVTARYPDNSTRNVTAGSTGTNYTSSNPAIATVSSNGFITAVSSGTVIIQANNDGATGMITARVTLSTGDSDGDGIPDDVELSNGMNPNSAIDAQEDFDRDDLTNGQEIARGTNLRNPDTDGDGLKDGAEVARGTNPLVADSDGDLIPDGVEVTTGTNPLDRASYDLAKAAASATVTPPSFALVTSTVNPDVFTQLTWRVNLVDGKTTLDITGDSRTNYATSDPVVCGLSGTKGRISAGSPGSCVITLTNGTLQATVNGTVRTFAPAEVSSLTVGGAVAVDVAGQYAYVAAGSSGLVIVDVTNRAQPAIRGTLGGIGTATGVRASGQHAYVTDSGGLLRVVNVQNPLAPTLVTSFPITGSPAAIMLRGTVAAVAAGSGGVSFVSLAAPASPSLISRFQTASPAQGVDFDGVRGLAAVAMGTSGLQILDISTLTAPQARSTLPGGDVRRLLVRHPAVILADAQRGYTSVDITNAASPGVSVSIPENFAGRPVDVAAVGNLTITADISFGRAVPIVSIADPLQPVPLGFWNLGGAGFSSAIAMDNSYGYLLMGSTLRIAKYQDLNDGFGVPPTVSLVSPPSGSILIQGQTMTLAANATDDVGVASVTFLAGGQPAGTSATSPFQLTYTVPAAATSITFGATALDYGGNVGTAANVTVQVIPDPLTTARGRVTDPGGSPVAGATVSSLGRSIVTAADGTFSLTGLPTVRGAIIVTATATVGGVLMGGVSAPADPIAGGVVTLPDIRLGPKPFLTSVTPSSALAGAPVTFTVSGSNFGGATFAFSPAGILINSASIAPSGTSATVNATIANGSTGRFALIATNPAGVSDSAPVSGFIVNPPPFNTISVPGADGAADADRDGLSNSQEITNGTDPLNIDTDGDTWIDGLEVELGSNPRSAASIPNPRGSSQYVTSLPVSILNMVSPGSSVSGSAQYVSSRAFSLLNQLNPSQGSVNSAQYVSSRSFSILNTLNPSTSPAGSEQFVTSRAFSLLNQLNPSQGTANSAQYVSSRSFSILSTLNPGASASGAAQYLVSKVFSILNGQSTVQTTEAPRVVSLPDRVANPRLREAEPGPDSDRDGIPDADEVTLGTNPLSVDTDTDGFPDGLELVLGSDPSDPSSRPDTRAPVLVTSPAVSIQNGSPQALRFRPVPLAVFRRFR